jgi:hypothetical protein
MAICAVIAVLGNNDPALTSVLDGAIFRKSDM